MEEALQKELESNELKLESVEDYYTSLRTLVESIESDVVKTSKGNKAAGIRLRKSLRFMKSHAGDFVKFTLSKN
jgi:hypothetical protein